MCVLTRRIDQAPDPPTYEGAKRDAPEKADFDIFLWCRQARESRRFFLLRPVSVARGVAGQRGRRESASFGGRHPLRGLPFHGRDRRLLGGTGGDVTALLRWQGVRGGTRSGSRARELRRVSRDAHRR